MLAQLEDITTDNNNKTKAKQMPQGDANNQGTDRLQVDRQQEQLQDMGQSAILQKLSHFFLTPTGKTIPYLYYFSKHKKCGLYCLAYLYNFIRCSYHSKQVCQIFTKLLPIGNRDKGNNMVEQILMLIIQEHSHESKQLAIGSVDRKTLITRYISLPSSMAEYLTKIKLNVRVVEQRIVIQLFQLLSQKKFQTLSAEEEIFIINKIVNLGYAQSVIKYAAQNSRLVFVANLYRFIVRKDKILMGMLNTIIESKSKNKQDTKVSSCLRQLIQTHHNNQQSQTLMAIFNSQHISPNNSQLIYQNILKQNPKLQAKVLENLLVWWVQGNDIYLTANIVRFKTNIMALILGDIDHQAVLLYSVQIGKGIQRRLMVANRVEVPNLIWAVLAHRLNFQVPPQFTRNLLISNQVQQHSQVKSQQQLDKIDKESQPLSQQKSLQKQQQQAIQTDEQQSTQFDITIKPPRNLYDCLLALDNPLRKKVAIDLLPKIIRKNPDDLIFVWKDLISHLMYNLNEDIKPAVVSLFIVRPQQFIQAIGEVFFAKESSLNDKIVLIQCLSQGVQELSSKPVQSEPENTKQEFYFKKVVSKYYKQQNKNSQNKQQKQKDQGRTRRWGHTRINYQKRVKQGQDSGINLKIISNQYYVNRLYQIANQLYFSLISKLALLSIFPNQPMFSVPMLKLLAILSFNLKNHIQKYSILTEITDICLHVASHINQNYKKCASKPDEKVKFIKKWKDTNLNVLNTLNKISLVIDKYIPPRMLQNLQKCVKILRVSHEYGIGPIIDMIQANLYTNISGNKAIF